MKEKNSKSFFLAINRLLLVCLISLNYFHGPAFPIQPSVEHMWVKFAQFINRTFDSIWFLSSGNLFQVCIFPLVPNSSRHFILACIQNVIGILKWHVEFICCFFLSLSSSMSISNHSYTMCVWRSFFGPSSDFSNWMKIDVALT